MIILGLKSKVIRYSPFSNHVCENCGSKNSDISILGSYAHIFWLPLFPYSKKLRIVCRSCNRPTNAKEASPELRQFANELKASVKFPFWMYVGPFVIIYLIGMLFYTDYQSDKESLEYLKEPQVNDIYFYNHKKDTTGYQYSIWKVNNIKGDSVYIATNAYFYMFEVYDLAEDDGFYDYITPMHKDYLLKLYEEDKISTVRRGVDSDFIRELD